MGNKLSSCSCAPILRKAYRYEDSPWQNSRRRDGHLLRLWAEVFHVSASGAGTVKWQQVSEDLVPVNITCIQDSPECVFHITAYNSQVDKILDVRLLQPGTRIGQASECFVYWKDPMTNDTWGLNFTSPIDAKQFRECCSPSFKFSRKASSSYSLKLEPPGSKQKFKTKRKPVSTPASPNRSSLTYGREPQCTCMTQEQYARLRAQDPRYRSSTLPRTTTRAIETDAGAGAAGRSDKVAAATSSTSLYDNVTGSQPANQAPPKPAARQTETQPPSRPPKSQETSTMTTNTSTAPKTVTASVGTHGTNTNEESQVSTGQATQHGQDLKSEGVQAGGTLTSSKSSATSTRSKEHLQHMPKSVDYGDENESSREQDRHTMHNHNVINNNTSGSRRTKSKSTEDMNMDSSTLKRMLKPMPSTESPVTSPEMGRRRYGGAAPCPPTCGAHGHRHQPHLHHGHYAHIVNNNSRQSSQRYSSASRGVGVGAAPSGYPGRGLYLELGGGERDLSPPSDNVMFDNQCYATTPSSSNGNSDQEPCQRRDRDLRQHHHGQKPCLSRQASQSSATPAPGSPTSRLLLEYEMHLRNTLAKGMDAESYSLHTFEALLSQSMEDLEYNDNLPPSNQRSPYPPRRRPASQCSGGGSRSSTLPLPHRLERPHGARAERDGYYSDRNELMRERERDRERERGYLSDHNTRDRIRDRDQGYLSDHQSSFVSASRCASCIGESARSAWYRHSDGWRGAPAPGPRRSPWDSLPSLRHEGSLNDSGYRSNRADSFEQRGVFDRQDSVRSEYTSDRESSRYGIVQQASIDSTDSRICYLTSSEVCADRAHLTALGARVPDISFCHKAHTGVAKGDARFCCVAHHCCLAAGALVALTSNGRPKPHRDRSVDSHSSGGETADKGDGGSGSVVEPKRKTKHHHHHHHHHHHKIHNCPYHDVAPPPEEEPEEKSLVPKKTVSPYLYIPSKLEPNVQQLFSFIESVLSAWAAEEGLTSTGEYSEPDERIVRRRKLNKYKKRTDVLNIRRIVYEVSILQGAKLLGNVRFRHYHWKGTAQTCNEAFLRKISDDDRMSLTTAVSDEEEPGESAMNSPYKGKQTGAAAASFNCTGAVRKAGFLSVKKWLLRKKHQIELARKRGWKGYWVCLKGTTLLFYPCDSREGRSVEAAPKHLIIVDGAIMQPIPEHPKRDHIFCLSTAFGDAYLFQAPCQIELENWVNSIHSACAAAFARHRGKTGTLHLLQEEIYRLEKAIESDHKLKHMADLQQSVVSDPETRAQLAVQMLQWEENLERLHCEQFRLRCYMASLQSGELPNPKSLLTHVSRGTKSTLNKLGVFTVSSFHAFICARSPSLLNNLLAGRGATKRRAPNLSRSNSGSSRRSMQMSREEGEAAVRVSLPEGTTATVGVRDGMSVEEFLAAACARRSLNPLEHFVRVKKRRDMEDHNYFVPHRSDLIETYLHTHEVVEVCAKILYQVELQRTTLEQMWGFSVEAELIENAERQDELCCYVSRVEDKSVAMQNGIIKGDEIMVINGAIVSDLDMMYLESVLQEELSLVMMMRSSRTEPPELSGAMRAATDDIIDSLVCPPPPSDPPVISDDMISGLIVPAPAWSKELYSPEADAHGDGTSSGPPKVSSRTNSFEIENLLKSAEQVTGWCRSPADTRRGSPTGSVASAAVTPSRHLSDADKLRKVLMELVDTERAYVKHLNNLLENYLEPLKKETFLSNAEINALFGNIQEIVTFQRQFLQNLEEALEAEPNFNHFEFSNQFKNVLFAVGNAFLYYVNHFKLYSSFCASHSKAQKVLHPNEGNQALQEFLAARNPKQQHSSTLESYLIKPIQRILKYPLLLQQLRNLTDVNSEEHLHLVEALKGMEKVAEHINEMQRIHEEYGAIFDHLFRQHQKSCKQPIDLSPGDLLYYGGVEWLNISDFLGKIKKGLELHAMCFVFKSAVVFLCKERLRQKKKLMGVSSKNNSNEVEIIRYQVLIPVTEVQVRASSAKDMDSHFLWELIHLRSQLQRRSEKVYVLSNSTADFRNAFLKTIRQIIRESVRNMSLPSSRPAPAPPRAPHAHHTLDRPKHQVQVMQGSQTLGKTKKPKTTGQRLSAGNIEVGDLSRENSQEAEEPPQVSELSSDETTFRQRSKTLGDSAADAGKRAGGSAAGAGAGADGSKSEGEDEPPPPPAKRGLGRTPNHLTLSTTSTLSAGSTGSQARLIQSSHQPTQYQPTMVRELGSPVWKPRDVAHEAAPAAPTTLPRPQRPAPRAAHLSASRKSLAPDHRH